MKPSVGSLVLIGGILIAGSVTAQAIRGGFIIPAIAVVARDAPGAPTTLKTLDARGQVDFDAEAGTIYLLLPAVQAAREAARHSGPRGPGGVVARVEVARTVLTTAPLMFEGEGPTYFAGRDGSRLVVAIPRGGARVRVTLAPCCWAADPGGSAGSGPTREPATVTGRVTNASGQPESPVANGATSTPTTAVPAAPNPRSPTRGDRP